MRITNKMLAGFGAICAVVAILGGSMVWSLTSVVDNAGRVIGQRAPVVNSANEIKTAINGALAALRGYMLTGQPEQRDLRAHAWDEIAAAITAIDGQLPATADTGDQEKWNEVKTVLGELKAVQDRVEGIVGTPDAMPATTLLVKEGSPRVDALLASLTGMIEAELAEMATPERKTLLVASQCAWPPDRLRRRSARFSRDRRGAFQGRIYQQMAECRRSGRRDQAIGVAPDAGAGSGLRNLHQNGGGIPRHCRPDHNFA